MIPAGYSQGTTIAIVKQPNLTYKLGETRVTSHITAIEAIKQTIYKILSTERYKHIIYSWNFGIELEDLIGNSKTYAKAVLPDRISDALKPYDRVSEVGDFVFTDVDKNSILCTFTAVTDAGDIAIEVTVDV